ncbi:hypothetical protein HMN09_00160300 [Mycena chlorophos]|uniref:Uncharacterized protein n=1 Tax=Mycena chlorophos TaxID=658473 RepID=A0A8H6TNB8_MYCCL|nr:hypothetical protein HMN09_00160300 [Mycena chlorophos]
MSRRPGDDFVEETSHDVRFVGNWTRERGTLFHDGALMRTEDLGASVEVTFWGTGVKVLGSLGWNHSQLAVSLDGGNATIFDAYCCPPTGSIAQVVQFEAHGLGRGAHVLNVTNLVAGPHGSVLDIDAFIITEPPTQTLPLAILATVLLLFGGWMLWVRRRELGWEDGEFKANNAYRMVPTTTPLEDVLIEGCEEEFGDVACESDHLLKAAEPPEVGEVRVSEDESEPVGDTEGDKVLAREES